MELFETIRREYQFGVGTIKGVARKLGIHRRMVREALADAVPERTEEDRAGSAETGAGDPVHRHDSGERCDGASQATPHGAPDL